MLIASAAFKRYARCCERPGPALVQNAAQSCKRKWQQLVKHMHDTEASGKAVHIGCAPAAAHQGAPCQLLGGSGLEGQLKTFNIARQWGKARQCKSLNNLYITCTLHVKHTRPSACQARPAGLPHLYVSGQQAMGTSPTCRTSASLSC
jgi:hypothetical protein